MAGFNEEIGMRSASASAEASATAARARQVELILDQVETLPTLSPVAAKLLTITGSEDADLDEVIEILENDPSLSAQILGLVRRADRGVSSRVTTVRRAVLLMGLDAVRSAVLSVQVFELLATSKHRGPELDSIEPYGDAGADRSGIGFDREGFWRHSIAVACAAELIAAEHKDIGVDPEEAFLAGLIHDVGKLVLEQVVPRAYVRVLHLAERRACNADEVELQVLGLDNHAAGKRLGERWGLPQTLQNVMWLHAQPVTAIPVSDDGPLISIVAVARAVCRAKHLGWCGDFSSPADPRPVWRAVNLSQAGPESITERLLTRIAERMELLGLNQPSTPELLMNCVANANRQLAAMNVAMRDRARASVSQGRVLAALQAYHEDLGAKNVGAGEAAFGVLRSARGLWGASGGRRAGDKAGDRAGDRAGGKAEQNSWMLLAQETADGPWQLFTLGRTSAENTATVIEPPRVGGKMGMSLAMLTGQSEMSVAMLGSLPWLVEHFAGVRDIRELRLLPLSIAKSGEGAAGGAGHGTGSVSAVLVHDCEVQKASGLQPGEIRAIAGAWYAGLSAAFERERASRLHDRLMEAGRKQAAMQAKLTDAEAMAKLGTATAGAAHEMNTPLAVILGRAQLLAKRMTDERDRESAETIARAAKELGEIVVTLNGLASTPECKPVEVDLKAMVDLMATEARATIGAAGQVAKHPVAVQFVRCEGRASVDPALVGGALKELLTNAFAAAGGSSVQVCCEIERMGSRGEALSITVRDSGPGMSANTLRHAFDAFYSEKAAGRGRGLGLTRAKRFAQACGGDVTLDSQPGFGTLATIRVPVAVGAAKSIPGGPRPETRAA